MRHCKRPLLIILAAPGCRPGPRVNRLKHLAMRADHSPKMRLLFFINHRKFLRAKVAELVDALDLGSSSERSGGSNPPFRILEFKRPQQLEPDQPGLMWCGIVTGTPTGPHRAELV